MIIHVDILDASDLSDRIEGAFKVDFFEIQRACFFLNDTLLILVGALEQRLAASTFQPTALQTAFTQGWNENCDPQTPLWRVCYCLVLLELMQDQSPGFCSWSKGKSVRDWPVVVPLTSFDIL